jgi:hypothetical protein
MAELIIDKNPDDVCLHWPTLALGGHGVLTSTLESEPFRNSR